MSHVTLDSEKEYTFTGKGDAVSVTITVADIAPNMRRHVWEYGLKRFVFDAAGSAALSDADKQKKADAKVKQLYTGEVRVKSSSDPILSGVRTAVLRVVKSQASKSVWKQLSSVPLKTMEDVEKFANRGDVKKHLKPAEFAAIVKAETVIAAIRKDGPTIDTEMIANMMKEA